jgi:hypothetical protein
MAFKRGDKGPEVTALQLKLLSLGFALPKFGADGDLGDETLKAITLFRQQHALVDEANDFATTIPQKVVRAIEDAHAKLMADQAAAILASPVLVPEDFTNAHPGQQWRQNRQRPLSSITGITLHQTAVLFGENPARWFGLNCHLGVTRNGRSLLICPLDRIVFHANGLNGPDVGIELDGFFEGVEGKRRSFFVPPNDKDRKPLQATPVQIEATRATIRWICDEVRRGGGEVKFIHAHRQSSSQRESDPGERVWKEVGLWAQETLGLSDGGKTFTVGGGLRIPQVWDPSRVGVLYRTGEPGLG